MHASPLLKETFFNPTLSQVNNYLSDMKLEPDKVANIEETTHSHGITDNKLSFAFRNGKLKRSRFVEVFHRRKVY